MLRIGLGLSPFLVPPVGGVDVFLLIGQSNMVGRPTDNGSGSYPDGTLQYGHSDDMLKAAVDPLDHWDENAGDMGLARQFCIDYAAANPSRSIVLIPRADGGTGFGSGYWRDGGTGYEEAVDATNEVFAANPTWRLRAVLWHQGESDAGSETYETDQDNLITGLRADIDAMSANTPFILGRISPSSSAYDATIDAIQADTPNRLPYTAVVSATGLTLLGDNLHFDADSLDALGSRYFTALSSAVANRPSAPSQVTGLALTPGNGQLELAWDEPGSHSAITDYVIEYSTDNVTWTTFEDGVSTSTSATITGLTNGILYYVKVSAVSALGTGVASASVSDTPTDAVVTVEEYDFDATTGSATNYTFSGMTIGSGAVVICVSARGLSGIIEVTDVQVGGVSATPIDPSTKVRDYQPQQFFYLEAQSAGTADVYVEFNGTMSRGGVAVWTLSDDADMASAVVYDDETPTADALLSTSASVDANGVMLALATTVSPDASPEITWTGLTERTAWTDFGDAYGTATADEEFASAQTGLTVSAAPEGGNNALTVLAVPPA